MAGVTVYSLIGDDLRMALFTKFYDRPFDILTITCLTLFSLEILIFSIVVDDYFLSFYFWLDFVSTVSLISDINFIMD